MWHKVIIHLEYIVNLNIRYDKTDNICNSTSDYIGVFAYTVRQDYQLFQIYQACISC